MPKRDAREHIVVDVVGKQIHGNKQFMNRTNVHESYVSQYILNVHELNFNVKPHILHAGTVLENAAAGYTCVRLNTVLKMSRPLATIQPLSCRPRSHGMPKPAMPEKQVKELSISRGFENNTQISKNDNL